MSSITYDIFKNFIVGGMMTAGISYMGTYVDSLTGAILWSIPVSIIPTIYFMRESGKSSVYISRFVYTTTFALLLLVLSCGILAYYIKKDDDIVMPIVKATAAWILASSLFFYVVKRYKLESKFI
tara:strand:- start:1436 stop:1810 length:375 start_codon:yes stop_codon:yes gene_type:complete